MVEPVAAGRARAKVGGGRAIGLVQLSWFEASSWRPVSSGGEDGGSEGGWSRRGEEG